MGNFSLVAILCVKPENADTMRKALEEDARLSVANEPGCLQFDLSAPQDRPGTFVLYEVYTDADAFKAHQGMPHYAAFRKVADALVVDRSVHFMERLVTGGK
ncbi:MAG: antibiotic biosynthesis monooxygenase [Alphaproteobacteria bacterium]|nr:antibiotic biosynthesis monooxygenase [Alphaproteobacteria bacterium]